MNTNLPTKQKLQLFFNENEEFKERRPWFGQLEPTSTDDFSFAIIGDRCGITTPGVFEKGLELVNQLNPNFIFCVGDLIEGYWENEADVHHEWDYIDNLLSNLKSPFFHIVGNHDCGNETTVRAWRERKGFEYYAFRYHDVLFLAVNTEEFPKGIPQDMLAVFREATTNVMREPEKAKEHAETFFAKAMHGISEEDMKKVNVPSISEEQLAFFENVITENKDVKHTFVFMHKPSWKADSTEFQRLEQMLTGQRYTMVAGHLHQLEVTKKNNQDYIQMGRTGACWHGDGIGSIDHIVWVTVKNGVPSSKVIDLEAVSNLDRFTIE
jgi:hypothetical protein